MNTLVKLKKQLEQVEAKLDKHRAACADIHGNGTMRKARHSVNWDYYAKLKMELKEKIELAEWEEFAEKTRQGMSCAGCHALFLQECICSENYEDDY